MLAAAALATAVAGCGSSATRSTPSAKLRRAGGAIPAKLMAEERPIGRGIRFHPGVSGPVVGRCSATLGDREEAHVELFGANRVVLLGAGIGTRPPRRMLDGRVVRAACFGSLVTLDPTGTVYFRPGTRVTLGELFTAWGQALSATRIASFTGGRVVVYVDGQIRSLRSPRSLPLTDHAEIVLEVGPHVPPHTHFTFAQMPSSALR